MRFGPSQLSCLGSSVGRALCLEYRVSWVRVIFLGKVTALGVLCCFALFVCLTLLASFFLPSYLSFKNKIHVYAFTFIHVHVYTCMYSVRCVEMFYNCVPARSHLTGHLDSYQQELDSLPNFLSNQLSVDPSIINQVS